MYPKPRIRTDFWDAKDLFPDPSSDIQWHLAGWSRKAAGAIHGRIARETPPQGVDPLEAGAGVSRTRGVGKVPELRILGCAWGLKS